MKEFQDNAVCSALGEGARQDRLRDRLGRRGGTSVKRLVLSAAVAAVGSVLLSASASAEPANWGQEVKACNLTSCYPLGASRGGYVSEQAQDGQNPGYAWEIHNLARPGRSDPSLP